MKIKAAPLCAAIVLTACLGACAPGTGGMSGTNLIDGAQGTSTDEVRDVPGPETIPGGGITEAPADVAGPGMPGPGGGLPGGGLPGDGSAHGIDGAQGTWAYGMAGGAPMLGQPLVPGSLPGQIAQGTSVENPAEEEIPLKLDGLCLQKDGFVLLSDIVIGAEPIPTIIDDQEEFALSAIMTDGGVASASVTFFSSSPLHFWELFLSPSNRLERWVRERGLDLDFVPLFSLSFPMMWKVTASEEIVAATHERPSYLLVRGDPELIREIQITSEKRISQAQSVKSFSCPDTAITTQAPSGSDFTIIKGLWNAGQGRTFQMRNPPKK